MKRKAEPELMIGRDQVTAYSKADFSEGEEKFINFIVNYLKKREIYLSSEDLIVDLGCGPGNISERLSLEWPNVDIVGIDGSTEMLLEAESRKVQNKNQSKFQNITYVCADIKKIKIKEITSKKNVRLLISNSFIHHIMTIDEFFDFIIKLSSENTLNFHKDLIRPKDKITALELKAKCAEKYNKILADDYYASLKASYRKMELDSKILDLKLNSLEVIEESEEYLIVYGKV